MEKKITERIAEVLNEKDLKIFEDATERAILERTKVAEEEMESKYSKLSEEYVEKTLVERLETEKVKLVEEFSTKLVNLEEKVVSKLDSFLDTLISSQISDEAINKLATQEIFKPMVEGFRKLYSENFIQLDESGTKKLTEKDNQIKSLEKQLSESVSNLLASEERLEKAASFLLISEKTDGLTKSQKDRTVSFFKNKNFDEIKETVDVVVEMVKNDSKKPLVTEKKKLDINNDKKTVDTILTEDEHIVQPEDQKKKVLKEEKEPSITDFAERFM
jgi:hypothetical protein